MTSAGPGGGYTTETAQMVSVAKQVRDVSADIQGALAGLRAQLEPLAGAWQGPAALSFTALMERWNTDAGTLRLALEGIGDQLDGTGKAYDAREHEASAAIGNITRVLG